MTRGRGSKAPGAGLPCPSGSASSVAARRTRMSAARSSSRHPASAAARTFAFARSSLCLRFPLAHSSEIQILGGME